MKNNNSSIANIKNNLQTLKKDPNNVITIQLIGPKDDNPNIFSNPAFTSFIFPALVAIITTVIVRFLSRKTFKAELNKVIAETEKNNEEISKIKSSYKPIILNSLQSIQSHLFQDKINSLKDLIKSKSEIFNVEQDYHQGMAFIDDSDDFYQNVYQNLSLLELEPIKKNSLDNSGLFPSEIRNEFQKLIGMLYEVYNEQKRNFSMQQPNMPNGISEKLENIAAKFDAIIDLIRDDLHFDNTFIHEFIKEHQK